MNEIAVRGPDHIERSVPFAFLAVGIAITLVLISIPRSQ
jgi:hypothetical protein